MAAEPITAQRALSRMFCLAATGGRGLLEIGPMPCEEAEIERKRIVAWLGELALEDELETKENEILQKPIGTLSPQEAANATWRLEGLGVLAWALGKFDLPAYDQLINVNVLFPATGFLDLDEAITLLASPSLRPIENRRELQNQCFALHWRLRNFHLRPQAMNFRKFAIDCWFGPLDVSTARFCDDDLAIGDRPISQASEEEFENALSAASEHHLAINWLTDGGKLYSETDTST